MIIDGVFLDSIKSPKDISFNSYLRDANWQLVKNVKDFMKAVLDLPFGVPMVSFAHDLDTSHWRRQGELQQICSYYSYDLSDALVNFYGRMQISCGYHAAVWLVKFCHRESIPLPICFVHENLNLAGAENIHRVLDSYHKIV